MYVLTYRSYNCYRVPHNGYWYTMTDSDGQLTADTLGGLWELIREHQSNNPQGQG